MKQQICFESHSPEETRALARRLGAALPASTVIAAQGDLGAGKTVFAAGLATGLGVADQVTSPTFLFFHAYQGRLPFCHIDAYRLENLSQEEIALIGLDDCFRRENAVFVEWPEYIADWLPKDTVWLTLSRTEEEQRRKICFAYDDETQGWLYEIIGH